MCTHTCRPHWSQRAVLMAKCVNVFERALQTPACSADLSCICFLGKQFGRGEGEASASTKQRSPLYQKPDSGWLMLGSLHFGHTMASSPFCFCPSSVFLPIKNWRKYERRENSTFDQSVLAWFSFYANSENWHMTKSFQPWQQRYMGLYASVMPERHNPI